MEARRLARKERAGRSIKRVDAESVLCLIVPLATKRHTPHKYLDKPPLFLFALILASVCCFLCRKSPQFGTRVMHQQRAKAQLAHQRTCPRPHFPPFLHTHNPQGFDKSAGGRSFVVVSMLRCGRSVILRKVRRVHTHGSKPIALPPSLTPFPPSHPHYHASSNTFYVPTAFSRIGL